MEELEKFFFFRLAILLIVVKVPHSTRTTILVDPAYATAQEHVETRIRNFHFLSVFFCQIAVRAYFGSCNRWRN